MRAEFRRFLACIFIVGTGLVATSVRAQDTPAGPSDVGAEEAPELDDLRLLAQQSAMPHLGGDNPFILREASWRGDIEPGKARLIQVQLFKRNLYHFWLAVPGRSAVLNLSLYNGRGELVEGDSIRYETSNVASLIASPDETGLYYLRLSMQAPEDDPQRWIVIYAYR